MNACSVRRNDNKKKKREREIEMASCITKISLNEMVSNKIYYLFKFVFNFIISFQNLQNPPPPFAFFLKFYGL